jgi:TatD DNase family protein
MIDFHCHLDLYPDPGAVAREGDRRGLHILSVTTTPSAWEGTSTLAEGSPRIRTALGLHPQLAHERKQELPLFDRLLPRARYVGEVGLDGAPEFRAHWRDQVTVFEHVLRACSAAGGRILSVHSRRAATAVLDHLEGHPEAGVFVLHWFSGTQRELSRAMELGCWFSVGPAMLAGGRGRGLAAKMPRDRILTETDGPFARANDLPLHPWDVGGAVETLGGLWGATPGQASAVLASNLGRLAAHGR